MISLKELKRDPEWKNEYLQCLDARFVNICKSCKCSAFKGCCPGYSTTNRKKIKMVFGWDEFIKKVKDSIILSNKQKMLQLNTEYMRKQLEQESPVEKSMRITNEYMRKQLEQESPVEKNMRKNIEYICKQLEQELLVEKSMRKNIEIEMHRLQNKLSTLIEPDEPRYENTLYFVIARGLLNNGDIYGKFGNHKAKNEQKRFAAYDSTNPEFYYKSIVYNQNVMPNKNLLLDNYINNNILFKKSDTPMVRFKYIDTGGPKTDWFAISDTAAISILRYIEKLGSINDKIDLNNFIERILFILK